MEPFILKGVTPTGEEIGRGAYGTVYKVKHCGVNYAAKQIYVESFDPSESQRIRIRRSILREAYLQSSSPHPNIVRFIGMYHPSSMGNSRANYKGIPALVMELMECNLTRFIKQDGPLSLHSTVSILHDVSLGLWYLHSCNPPVIHRDLRPGHVLVNTNPLMAKIAGLGEVVPEDFNDELLPGTLGFVAPELLTGKYPHYSMSSDVFSYGGVALYVVIGEWPMPSAVKKHSPETRQLIALSEVE